MSKFCDIKTTFKDEESLVAALMDTSSWTRDKIEVHKEAQHLFGYVGDQRAETAHVIVRRQYIGGSSNDLGFQKQPDGTFKAIISQFDMGNYGTCGKEWMTRLKENYAFHQLSRQQRQRGRAVSRITLPNGRRGLAIQGYR